MLAGVSAALVVWTVAVPIAGGHPAVKSNGETQPVGMVAVVVAALFAGLAAWALLAILERFVRRSRLTWTVVAAVVLALSLTGPLGSGVHASAVVTLTCMHLAVGAVLITLLRRSARFQDPR